MNRLDTAGGPCLSQNPQLEQSGPQGHASVKWHLDVKFVTSYFHHSPREGESASRQASRWGVLGVTQQQEARSLHRPVFQPVRHTPEQILVAGAGLENIVELPQPIRTFEAAREAVQFSA